MRWSPDSRWLAYARPTGTANSAIFLYDTKTSKLHRATTGYLNDEQPMFDPDGKYLFYLSDREFDPVYGSFDNSWTYPNPTKIVAVPLRKDVPSPLAARNDSEDSATDTNKSDEQKKADAKKEEKKEEKQQEKKDEAKPAAPNVDIDLDGFETRAVVLPPKAGNYTDLQAIKGKVLYRRQPRTGSGEEKNAIVYFDLVEREEKTVLDDAGAFEVTADGKKMLVSQKDKFAILEIKAAQKFEKPIVTADMEAPVDPRAEWRQMFADAFRFERDYFYDPGTPRRRLGRHAPALRQAARRRDDALGCRLRARRVHRRAECLAYLLRRRRQRAGAVAKRRHAGRGLGADQRRLPHQDDRPRRSVGCRRAVCRSTSRA